ncbi:MAG: ferredoxin--NADP reductase [Acidobacteriota bacterium]|nr:ferredoxin--NADP reductase [Acidobacteriota bacterium]
MSRCFNLRVSALARDTADALTITLDLTDEAAPHFQYRAGQFLTLDVDVAGETCRRAYSLNSAPSLHEPLQITVKRIENGRVSNHLHGVLRQGDQLRVQPPAGKFCPDIDPKNYRTWFLFGAGSGITPLLAIMKEVLTVEPDSYVYLLYGNRDEDNIIHHRSLADWQQRYPERLTVMHTLTKPNSAKWSALWKNVPKWKGWTGRIDEGRVRRFIQEYPPPAQTARYCICGPGDMIRVVTDTLLAMDVPKKDIMAEHFGAPKTGATTTGVAATLKTRLDGKPISVPVPTDRTLLRALLDAGHDAPYSCEAGVCGACTARLTKGSVTMSSCMALDEAEQAAGKILTCQAVAKEKEIAVRFD